MEIIKDQTTTHCANCQTTLHGPFCHKCGQKKIRGRFSLKLLFGAFLRKLFDIDSGLLFTIKKLFIQPGVVCRDYLQGAQVKYAKPVQYFFLTTALIFLFFGLTESDELFVQGFEEGFSHGAGENGKEIPPELKMYISKFFFWMKDIRLFILSSIPIYALMFKWVFRTSKLNYAEHIIFLLFVTAQSNLISFPFFLLGNYVNTALVTIGTLASFLYTVWATKRFHQSSWGRSIMAYLLSTIFYFFVLILVFMGIGVGAYMANPELFSK